MGATKKRACCCPPCKNGAVIDRWVNDTKARPVGDTLGPNYTAIPFPRIDPLDSIDCPPGTPKGVCGSWVLGGTNSPVVAQELDDGVDDIKACSPDDSTHKKSDHNCYQKSGTVDMRSTREGAQFILAKKFQHGREGFQSQDCSVSAAPEQSRWRKIKRSVKASVTGMNGYRDNAAPDACGGAAHVLDTQISSFDYRYEKRATYEVARNSGVVTQSDLADTKSVAGSWFCNLTSIDATNQWYDNGAGNGSGTGFSVTDGTITDPSTGTPVPYPCPGVPGTTTPYWYQGGFGSLVSAVSLVNSLKDWALGLDAICGILSSPSSGLWADLKQLIEDDLNALNGPGSTSSITWDYSEFSNVTIKGSVNYHSEIPAPTTGSGDYCNFDVHFEFEISLSEPYTLADLYQDALTAINSWDMSDFNLAALRADSKLALAPLCCYDEVGGVRNPDLGVFVRMDDYTQPRNVDLSWPQRDWLDGVNYFWRNSAGGTNGTMDVLGGNILVTPLFDGSIIAHNPAGFQRHFDFDRHIQHRLLQEGSGIWLWVPYTIGAFSSTELPPVTLRELDNDSAMYDPVANRGGADDAPGNFPQSFINQGGGVIVIGKYVEPAFEWLAVNYGRPCGEDRYAVNQETVCFVVSGSCASGTVTVKKTGNAIAPTAPGGLAVGNYIASETEGFYLITGITDNLDATFTLTVGAKIEDLPTNWKIGNYDDTFVPAAQYLGALRWVNFVRNSVTRSMPSPICGRAACTTSWLAGTVTVTFTDAQPWLRKDVTNGKVVVDLWNSTHTVKVGDSVELTRVSDTVFTYAAGADPVAAWATGEDYLWTDCDATPQHTGVSLEYTFNPRQAQLGYPSPPTFFEIAGCLGCTKKQFNYTPGACRAMVGFVPFVSPLLPSGGEIPSGSGTPPVPAPVEDFSNQELFEMPPVFPGDNKFGAHWQAEVDMVMPDPFWQPCFMPNGGVDYGTGESMTLNEDDGSGNSSTIDSSGAALKYIAYYPHRPWVEAVVAPPAGKYLPSSPPITVFYSHDISPMYYLPGSGGMFAGGIGIGDTAGNYGEQATAYGFRLRAKATIAADGTFAADYQKFVL